MKTTIRLLGAVIAALTMSCAPEPPPGVVPSSLMHSPGKLKPIDSRLAVRVGDRAPGFTLPAVSGTRISLSDYRARKNVILSFVPAAFTPVCSAQWPGYNLASDVFAKHDAVMLGITTDNLPSLHAWTGLMGKLDFQVLSDFWPHGKVAGEYGLLRSDGTTERALILIDKQGVIRWIDVHDINVRPPLEELVAALENL